MSSICYYGEKICFLSRAFRLDLVFSFYFEADIINLLCNFYFHSEVLNCVYHV